MTVYVLSKANEDYTTEYEVYGVFSSRDKAVEYAMKEAPNYPIEGIDKVPNNCYSYWAIDEWIVDSPLEVI